MKTGILLLDKSTGVSSARAISGVKHKLRLEKIGHAGTLDPLATGLLVCLCGAATRVASYAEEGQKCYSGEFLFGRATDTDDVTGTTLAENQALPTPGQVQAALGPFLGSIEQVPPCYSAIKLQGQRAYDLARRGETVELKARVVEVVSLELEPTAAPERYRFLLRCSPGTYVRSLARDIGKVLGCGGCLATLRREASFPFTAANAKTLEDLQLNDMLEWSALFPGMPQLMLDEPHAKRLTAGDQRVWAEIGAEPRHRLQLEGQRRVLFGSGAALLGIAECTESRWSIVANIGATPECPHL